MTKKNHALQVGRAIAAMVVVLWHCRKFWPGAEDDGATPAYAYFGAAGVDIFFVLSGYIISMVAAREPSVSSFIQKRLVRILPFYWLFTAAYLTLKPGGWSGSSPAYLASSFLVFPMADLPALFVGWSLEHEFIFYALVAIHLVAGRVKLLPVSLTALTLVSFGWNLFSQTESVWDYHLLSLYHVQFLAGIVLYQCREQVQRLPWKPLFIAAILSAPASAYVVATTYDYGHLATQPSGIDGLIRVLAFGSSGALILAALLSLGRHLEIERLPGGGRLIEIGDASYALYLSHPIVLGVVGFVGPRLGASAAVYWGMATAGFIGSIVLAVLFYRLVEKPYLNAIDRRRPISASGPIDGPA